MTNPARSVRSASELLYSVPKSLNPEPESLKRELLGVLQGLLPPGTEVSPETLSAVIQAIRSVPWAPVPEDVVSQGELTDLHSSREFIQLLRTKNVNVGRIKRAVQYEFELEQLQVELVKLVPDPFRTFHSLVDLHARPPLEL